MQSCCLGTPQPCHSRGLLVCKQFCSAFPAAERCPRHPRAEAEPCVSVGTEQGSVAGGRGRARSAAAEACENPEQRLRRRRDALLLRDERLRAIGRAPRPPAPRCGARALRRDGRARLLTLRPPHNAAPRSAPARHPGARRRLRPLRTGEEGAGRGGRPRFRAAAAAAPLLPGAGAAMSERGAAGPGPATIQVSR